MIAELGIDEDGHAELVLRGISDAEYSLLERFKAFLPVTNRPHEIVWRITGDRLPGMTNLKAQDATGKVAL